MTDNDKILLFVILVIVAVSFFVVKGLKKANEIDKKNAEKPTIVIPRTNSMVINYDVEAENIKKQFNWLIGSFLGLVLFQGIGVNNSIGLVLQESFDISRSTSLFVVWLLALPLFLILRGMQILTNAILLNNAKNKN